MAAFGPLRYENPKPVYYDAKGVVHARAPGLQARVCSKQLADSLGWRWDTT